jgi:hypothetical protein
MAVTVNIFAGGTAPNAPKAGSAPGSEATAQDAGVSVASQPGASASANMTDAHEDIVSAGAAPDALVQEVEAALRKAAATEPPPASYTGDASDAGSAPA